MGHDARKPVPEVIKLFSCSTQLSTKFILFINVKMPTTFISMINTTSGRHKAKHFFICRYFSFYELLKFRAKAPFSLSRFKVPVHPGLMIRDEP